MADYIRLTCPQCGRDQVVRPEYLGQNLGCRHCGQTFRAVDEATTTARGVEGAGEAAGAPGDELRQVRAQLASRAAQHAQTLKQLLEAERLLTQAEERAAGLKEELDRARARAEQAENRLREERDRSEAAETRSSPEDEALRTRPEVPCREREAAGLPEADRSSLPAADTALGPMLAALEAAWLRLDARARRGDDLEEQVRALRADLERERREREAERRALELKLSEVRAELGAARVGGAPAPQGPTPPPPPAAPGLPAAPHLLGLYMDAALSQWEPDEEDDVPAVALEGSRVGEARPRPGAPAPRVESPPPPPDPRRAEIARVQGEFTQLLTQKRLEEATDRARRLVDLRRDLLGEAHPEFALSLNTLAMTLQVQGDAAAALSLYERASVITRAALGASHPTHQAIVRNLERAALEFATRS